MKRLIPTAGLLVALLFSAFPQSATGSGGDAGPSIGLKLIAEGFSAPAALAALPDASGRLLIADQAGIVYLLDRDGKRAEKPFLDLRPEMTQLNQGMDERGLLGLALHPQFLSNLRFYVVYSAPLRAGAPPKWDHTERLSEFRAADESLSFADPASERVLLEIDEPDWNHNSGRIAFGPDGYLYCAVGDGGAPNDMGDEARGRGHPPEGFGQSLDTLLGKVLRLDVDRGSPYAIPPDNPFADGKKGRPEIFAYGLRNPWGLSFDRGGNRDLIVTDVGQDRWEEINVIVKGGNYGWRLREGFDGFDPDNPRSAPTDAISVAADGRPFVDPVYVYRTRRGRDADSDAYGVTITGGHVYRGKAFPSLVGRYVFADWSRHMGFADGTLLVATIPPPGSDDPRWSVEPLALSGFPDGRIKAFIWALGEDADGELYVLTNGANMVRGDRGKIFKLVPQENTP